MVSFTFKEEEQWVLTEEGQEIAESGSHEAKVFNAVPAEGSCTVADLQTLLGEAVAKIGMGKAFQHKWIGQVEGGRITRKVACIQDVTCGQLCSIRSNLACDESALKELKRRKLVDKEYIKAETAY